MPKKFKRTTYEKDNDDHYVVVLNPWNRGCTRRSQVQIDWIGAWLRIAFRKPTEKNIVKNIYTVETRSEVIARIDSSVNIEIVLGLHYWEEFMEHEALRRIKRQTGFDLSDNASHIFLYNWTLHGDPAERQWQEWFPRQDAVPRDIMIRWDYPEPDWCEIPIVDARLRSFLIPIRPNYNQIMQDDEQESTLAEDDVVDNRQEEEAEPKREDKEEFETRRLQSQSPRSQPKHPTDNDGSVPKPSKADKLDPYEEDEAARVSLNVVTDILNRVKEEADIKPDIRNGYRPSNALSSAISQLQDSGDPSEAEDRKPIIKTENDLQNSKYRPSVSLTNAISQLRNGTSSPKDEDHKPAVKREEYAPSIALLNALSEYSAISSPDAGSVLDNIKASKRSLGDNRGGSGGADSDSSRSELRSTKRVKVEGVLHHDLGVL